MGPARRQCGCWFGIVCLGLAVAALPARAQDTASFDDIAAAAELEEIAALIQSEALTSDILAQARATTVRLETEGAECASESTEQRQRLEARFEPLRDIDSQFVGAGVWDQRQQTKTALDEAVARQARCIGIVDRARERAVSANGA